MEFWSIPLGLWRGETVVIAATGPSLTMEQLDRCQAAGFRLIVVHISWRLAPWADWCFAGDQHRSWTCYPELHDFAGTKIAVWGVDPPPKQQAELGRLAKLGVKVLRHFGNHVGLSEDPMILRGNNSVAQLLSVIHFTCPNEVILLGVDMKDGSDGKSYWTGTMHPWQSGHGLLNYPVQAQCIETMAVPLQQRGVKVVNATPGSALRCFPATDLQELTQ